MNLKLDSGLMPLLSGAALLLCCSTSHAADATYTAAEETALKKLPFTNITSAMTKVTGDPSAVGCLKGTIVGGNFYSGYCTAHVASKFAGIDWTGSANEWLTNAKNKGWATTSDLKLAVTGAIYVNGNHVAYVESYDGSSLALSEANNGKQVSDPVLASFALTDKWNVRTDRNIANTTAGSLILPKAKVFTLTVTGPTSGTAGSSYTYTAKKSDNTDVSNTVTWTEDSSYCSFVGNKMTTTSFSGNQTVKVTASLSGVTQSLMVALVGSASPVALSAKTLSQFSASTGNVYSYKKFTVTGAGFTNATKVWISFDGGTTTTPNDTAGLIRYTSIPAATKGWILDSSTQLTVVGNAAAGNTWTIKVSDGTTTAKTPQIVVK
jgi:hypothetical protein